MATLDAGHTGGVADGAVGGEGGIGLLGGNQIGFAGDDAGFDVVVFADHQIAVEHAWVELGLGQGYHDNCYVDIGDDDVFFAATAKGRYPRQASSAGEY